MPLALAELLLRGTSLGLDHAEPVGFKGYGTGVPFRERETGNSVHGFYSVMLEATSSELILGFQCIPFCRRF